MKYKVLSCVEVYEHDKRFVVMHRPAQGYVTVPEHARFSFASDTWKWTEADHTVSSDCVVCRSAESCLQTVEFYTRTRRIMIVHGALNEDSN